MIMLKDKGGKARTVIERKLENFRRFRNTTIHNTVEVLVHILREKLSEQRACLRSQLRWLEHCRIARSDRPNLDPRFPNELVVLHSPPLTTA